MTRLPLIALCLLLSASALAQQHKISVQKYVPPKYPPIARQARIEGDVKLSFDVSADGEPQNIRILSGHAMLSDHAIETLRGWRFHCDDCRYRETFKHELVMGFHVAHAECNSGITTFEYQFPAKATINQDAPCVETNISH